MARPFRCPFVPAVPILGIAFCLLLMLSLPEENWYRLFGWMALTFFVFFPNPHLKPDHAAYWFLMQVGMILGFLTSFPANRWLITRGIKEGM